MIGVQVGEEQGVDLCERNPDLLNALRGTSTAIEEQLFLARFDQNTGAEAVYPGLRGARAEQGHFQILSRDSESKYRVRNQQEKTRPPWMLDRNVHGEILDRR